MPGGSWRSQPYSSLPGPWLGYRYLWPATVDHQIVTLRPLEHVLTAPATLDATGRIAVSARIAGRLLEAPLEPNAAVTKGAILGRISAQEMGHELAAAEADARAADNATTELHSQRAAAVAALRRAGSHLERRRTLVRNAVVSRDEIEQAETDLVRAQAEVARIDAALERAASLTAAAIAQARAAAARLDDAVVRAPADGVVIAREANPGDTVAPGAPLYRLVDPATLVVEARFDESVLGLLGAGTAAEVRFTSDPRQPIQGRITRLHREVDPATREFTVEIALSSLPRNWALGQRATVLVRAAGDLPVLAIDQRFLARRDGRPGVWRAEGGRAHWRPVGLGMPAGDAVEITTGLAAGDVVLDPAGRYGYEPIADGVRMS